MNKQNKAFNSMNTFNASIFEPKHITYASHTERTDYAHLNNENDVISQCRVNLRDINGNYIGRLVFWSNENSFYHKYSGL